MRILLLLTIAFTISCKSDDNGNLIVEDPSIDVSACGGGIETKWSSNGMEPDDSSPHNHTYEVVGVYTDATYDLVLDVVLVGNLGTVNEYSCNLEFRVTGDICSGEYRVVRVSENYNPTGIDYCAAGDTGLDYFYDVQSSSEMHVSGDSSFSTYATYESI